MADTENPSHKKDKPQIHDYPLWKLEHIAQEALKDADHCIENLRVDIEILIEAKYKIIIDIHYGLQTRFNILAWTLTQSNRMFIDDKLIDDPRQSKRYRFTLAEELAHFIIHEDIYRDCKSVEERIERENLLTRQEQWFVETNAKALGSAILMPKRIIDERIDQLLSAIGDSPSHTSPVINILSRDFDVNPKAIRRRLLNLGYHRRSNLRLKNL